MIVCLKQHLDDHRLFDLRFSSYLHQNRIKSSSVYGYSGARIDLYLTNYMWRHR